MATPIFEFTEVFARPIGEHTDIVAKEMYTFTDRGGEEVTLAAGEHRRGGARGAVERPDPERAAQILLQRPDVPLRAAAEGPLPAVPPDRRRADRRGAAAGRYRGHRARAAASSTRSASASASCSSSTRSAIRRAAPPTARRSSPISRRASPSCRRTAGGGSNATRCASSIRRRNRPAGRSPMLPPLPIT